MQAHTRTLLIPVAIVVAGLLVYATRLEVSPIYLAPDEVIIALNAHALASTGHDLNDRFLPLYIQINDRSWYQPIIVYSLVAFLKVLPFSEATIRLPTACIGVLDVLLMYLLARRLLDSPWVAIVAAGLLALTPAHFIHSRFAMDYVYPLPFITAWLLCLAIYAEHGQRKVLFGGTSALGLGFYSYIASVLMMPVYVLATCWELLRTKRPAAVYFIAVAGFALPLLLFFVPWLIRHPTAYADTVRRYALYNSQSLDALAGMREYLSYPRVTRLISLYWSYFDPAFLFFDATAPRMFSTRWSGVFLLAVAVFLPVGIYRVVSRGRTRVDHVLLLGLATGPVAAVLVDEIGSINRALEIVPFAILLATIGFEHLWSAQNSGSIRALFLRTGLAGIAIGTTYTVWTIITQSRISHSSLPLILASAAIGAIGLYNGRIGTWRIVAACLLAAIPLQFTYFYVDYFSDYRARASDVFYSNIRGGLEEIIEREPREHFPAIYLSGDIQSIEFYWRLYLIKHGREDLLGRTMQFNPLSLDVTAMPPQSVIMTKFRDGATEALEQSGELKRITLITDPGDRPAFVILQR